MDSAHSKKQCSGNDPARNYWTPLQALCDDDDISDSCINSVGSPAKKPSISPIKVLVRNTELINTLIAGKGIKDFFIKKISIGIKILCDSIDSFNKIKSILVENDCQFFTHDQKADKMFKAVIYGLDRKSGEEVKTELNSLGFKCIDVKCVTKNYDGGYTDTIYIVNFENGSVKLFELRTKCKSLFRTIIKWDYQRKLKNKPVQCRNCQMYGHGERGCNIKSMCGFCAGKHRTDECKNSEKLKCANCNGNHKSSDISCPNRESYLEIRNKISFNKVRQNPPTLHKRQFSYNASNFPQLPISCSQNITSSPSGPTQKSQWSSSSGRAPSSNLFTEQEFAELTFEMISKLKECSSKEQQFNVIAQLAIKYLYSCK